jgi:hypothetical protein
VGTANPFWGGQVWVARETEDNSDEEMATEEQGQAENSGSSGGGCHITISGQSLILLLPLLIAGLKRIK